MRYRDHKDLIKFLLIARGSLWELSTQIEICERLNYFDASKATVATGLITEISKMLNALLASISYDNQ